MRRIQFIIPVKYFYLVVVTTPIFSAFIINFIMLIFSHDHNYHIVPCKECNYIWSSPLSIFCFSIINFLLSESLIMSTREDYFHPQIIFRGMAFLLIVVHLNVVKHKRCLALVLFI